MDAPLLKPKLYGDDGHNIVLHGGACPCGYVFFPMQSYGCERCGRTDCTPRLISGHGALLASTRVHLHAGKTRTAPFSVGAVKLDEGPIVRTIVLDDDVAVAAGARMIACFVDVEDSEGAPRRDLRFKQEG